jgi:hypothetical protein
MENHHNNKKHIKYKKNLNWNANQISVQFFLTLNYFKVSSNSLEAIYSSITT